MKQTFFHFAVFAAIICSVWGLPKPIEKELSVTVEKNRNLNRLGRDDDGSYHGEGSNSPGQAYISNESSSLSASPGVATMMNSGVSAVFTPGQTVYTIAGKQTVVNRKK